MHGGDLIGEFLKNQGVRFLFTLCGGHISPILTGCKGQGIRVIDTRHEATAVFAADAVARLTGRPGVAAVTAGPGVTNTITALKNAQIAQSPVVLIGGAVPTALRGRGALQDIDQMALIRPHVKWAKRLGRVAEILPNLKKAFFEAQNGVPGPVFLEIPVDLLYPEAVVREMYGQKAGSQSPTGGRTLAERISKVYLERHVRRLFAGVEGGKAEALIEAAPPEPDPGKIRQAAERLLRAERPLLLIGSQATLLVQELPAIARAVERLGIPAYLSGMARGLLGRDYPLQYHHKRREALKEADLVILAGVPCDFRLDYGRQIRRRAFLVSANRSPHDLTKNRRPQLGVLGDPGIFLQQLAQQAPDPNDRWLNWKERLREREDQRSAEIRQAALQPAAHLNPLHLLGELDRSLAPDSIIVADGGDFVGTASYVIQPAGPLAWLDPGAFGTLGVGAGFALGAKLCHPEAEVWILYGDGSAGYSLAEFDTFVRHSIPVIAVVGNDAGWSQIAREQVEILGDDVGTILNHSDYHRVVGGFGAAGYQVKDPELVPEVLQQAKGAAAGGRPVLINAILDKTDFRKGSISM
ncbi:MAG: thiamine pyrophosphate-binding protein [Omnitrophica WOR_2 bacterium]